jgi:hypothetical protein
MASWTDPGPVMFEAVIESASGGGCWVRFPYDATELFGTKGRVPVKATFDDVAYTGSLVAMDGGAHVIGVLKAIREQLGKQVGDSVDVVLTLDAAPRTVDVPTDLASAIAASDAASASFASLSHSHRREYVQWVTEAKRDETRRRRIEQTVQRLSEGRKSR